MINNRNLSFKGSAFEVIKDKKADIESASWPSQKTNFQDNIKMKNFIELIGSDDYEITPITDTFLGKTLKLDPKEKTVDTNSYDGFKASYQINLENDAIELTTIKDRNDCKKTTFHKINMKQTAPKFDKDEELDTTLFNKLKKLIERKTKNIK
ncbi:MAG: hypothetical protein WCK67_03160 [bacterium]